MWGAILALLLAPLLAMRFTNEVGWTGFDFAVAGLLLIGAGAIFELAAPHINDFKRRSLFGSALIILVVTISAHGAIGIL